MSVSDTSEHRSYSIAAVSKLTGISCHALRAWERRFGYPVPLRSPSGHRRYVESQVRTLRQLALLLQQGKSIGELMNCLQADCLPDPTTTELHTLQISGKLGALTECLLVADYTGASQLYRALAESLPPGEVLSQIIEPLMVEIGERWFQGSCAIYQERCATAFLMRKLAALMETAQSENPHPTCLAVVGTVQGERHEAGASIFSLLLETAGWRAICLGSDVPVPEFQKAIDHWKPDALGVSFVLSRNINKRFDELSALQGAPIFVGGRSILNYQGLARKYGLIPLPGPAGEAMTAFLEEMSTRPARPDRS